MNQTTMLKLDQIEIPTELPLTNEQLASGPWSGITRPGMPFAHASIFESQTHRGFFHARIQSQVGVSETKKPMFGVSIGILVDHCLEPLGLTSNKLTWRRADIAPVHIDEVREQSRASEIVYFLSAGDFVKIGKATGDAHDRVAALKTGCPFPIRILATTPGGYELERELHKRFRHLRSHGEWFHAAPELLRYVASIGGVA